MALLPHVPPQALGAPDEGGVVGEDVGEAVTLGELVGLAVGEDVGLAVGEAVGEAVGLPVARVIVKVREHLGASCARGTLEGAAGEMEVCLNW